MKKKTKRRRPKPRRPRLNRAMTAFELARAFLAETGCTDAEEEERTELAVLNAAELIYELSGPLQWEAFNAQEYFRRVDFLPPREQVGIGIVLAGFFGWMGLHDLLQPQDAQAIIEEIGAAAPDDPLLQQLCASGHAMLSIDPPNRTTSRACA